MSDIIKIIKCTAACFGNMYIHIQMRVKPCVYRYERWQYSKKRATQTAFHEAMLFNPCAMNCGKVLKTTSCNISLFCVTIKNDGKTHNRNKMLNQKSYKTDFTITKIKMFFFSFLNCS